MNGRERAPEQLGFKPSHVPRGMDIQSKDGVNIGLTNEKGETRLIGRREKRQQWFSSHLKGFVTSATLANGKEDTTRDGGEREVVRYAKLERDIKGKGKTKGGKKEDKRSRPVLFQ